MLVPFAALVMMALLWLIADPLALRGGSHYAVVGAPSVSANFIDQVLTAYESPAAGKGQALYADGIAYHIDPVYALAFFLVESRFGTAGVARVTHSLGNIRALPGEASYEGYRRYTSWEQGFADWYRLIDEEYVARGLITIDQIVPVYAPATDSNDVAAYIRTVKLAVDTWRAGKVFV
ncbi:glucosaminidase domain-containing protein [Thermogemmatispora sp.]|uniref:glucosaminidase domain-containing protein n=1 Tax=Thermogemmatispora sp. TaxID=1968838 RepID=UPI001D47457D|nr:glucosaminidase domain-containing protein [Thermogemmatispora sp.]MBX5448586.1 glucosaminidase domain-containing protein [Thermogemmatispora sp.]